MVAAFSYLLAFALILRAAPGHAENTDQALPLSIFLDSRAYEEGTKRFVYRMRRLDAGLELFRYNPVQALGLLKGTTVPSPLEREWTKPRSQEEAESRFVTQYATVVDTQINGLTFGDTPLSTIFDIANLAVANTLAPVAGAASYISVDKLAEVQRSTPFIDPLTLPSTTSQVAAYTSRRTFHFLESEPILAPFVQDALKKDLKISDVDKISNSAEYRSFQNAFGIKDLRQDVDALKASSRQDSAQQRQALQSLSQKIDGKILSLSEAQARIMARNKRSVDDLKHTIAAQGVQQQKDSRTIEEIRAAIVEKETQQRIDSEKIEKVRLYFGAASFLGQVAGVSSDSLATLNKLGQIAEISQRIALIHDEPFKLANGYLAIAQVVFSLFGNRNRGPNPHQLILMALRDLATQINELRELVTERFDRLDSNLAGQFANQEKMLEKIQRYEEVQTTELKTISLALSKSRNDLEGLIMEQLDRTNQFWRLKCRNLGPNDSSELRDCAVQAYLTATNYALAPSSVLNSLSDLLADTGNKDLAREYYRSIPAFAKARSPNGPPIANPEVWSDGARLLTKVFKKAPAMMALKLDEDKEVGGWSEIIDQGKEIQRAYREMFLSPDGNGRYRIDPSLIQGQVDLYAQALGDYIRTYADAMKSLDFPFLSPVQPLPYEGTGKFPGEAGPPPSDAQRQADPLLSHASPERGQVDFDKAAKAHEFLRSPVPLCWFRLDSKWQDELFDQKNPWVSQDKKDSFGRFRSSGISLLDASILGLIPREALWLEHVDGTHNKIKICVKEMVHRRTRGNFPASGFNVNMLLRLDVSIQTSAGVIPLGDLLMNYQMAYPKPYFFLAFPDPYVSSPLALWDGVRLGDTQFGPVRGQMDKYFEFQPAAPQVPQAHADDRLTALIDRLRPKFEAELRQLISIGPVKTTQNTLERQYKTIRLMQFLNASGRPDIENMLGLLDDMPLPGKIREALENGARPEVESRHAIEQIQSIKLRVTDFSGRNAEGQVRTPVDELLSELQLLQSLVHSVQ